MTKSRFDYTEFSNHAQMWNEDMTATAKNLESQIEKLPAGREKALALTKLEESVMWARKALREVK